MSPWLRLSVAGAATLMVGMGLGRFSYAPMIPALVNSGQMTAAEAGAVGAFNLAFFLGGILAAPLMRRNEIFWLRLCLLTSLLCLAASVLPWGFAWLAFWRSLVGAAMGAMMILALAVVTRHAPPHRLGAATGIAFAGVGAAILLTGTLVPFLLDRGLAAAWAGLAALGATGTVVGLWGWKAGSLERADETGANGPAPAARIVRALTAAQTLFMLGLIPHTVYWVDYLVRGLGRTVEFGGMHWVLFGAGALAGTYLWGRLADAIGFRGGLVLVFSALAVGVALPVLETASWALALSSLAVGAQPGFSAIITGRTRQLAGEWFPTVWRRMNVVGGCLQAAGGYGYVALFARADSHVPVFLTGGAAMALGAFIAWRLRDPGR